MAAYYNDNDAIIAGWLRELIKAGLIEDGEVDERDIRNVAPDDVRGFRRCHFFAGIGGWPYAFRLASWPDDREAWTFSCPCQRFSSATHGVPAADDLWPEQRRLIIAGRPRVFFGEQVASARAWFDGICDDVEPLGYSVAASVLPAVSIGADHLRHRLYFVGDTHGHSQPSVSIYGEVAGMPRRVGRHASAVVPTHDVSRDMAALSGLGNAIVPPLAQAFIEAYCEARGL